MTNICNSLERKGIHVLIMQEIVVFETLNRRAKSLCVSPIRIFIKTRSSSSGFSKCGGPVYYSL